jgi:hypothetical protein
MVDTLRRIFGGGHRHYTDVISAIVDLGKLEPGWNSYDAPRVAEAAQLKAIALVNDFQNISAPVPPPDVGPTPEGGVALRWLTRDREIDVHFTADDAEYTVLRRGTTTVVTEGRLVGLDLRKDIVYAHILGNRSIESYR